MASRSQHTRTLIREGLVEQTGIFITKTRPYNFDPLKPHFYIVKLGFIGVYIFLILLKKT